MWFNDQCYSYVHEMYRHSIIYQSKQNRRINETLKKYLCYNRTFTKKTKP